ncbi:hypothetical protein SAMN05216390_10563 [Lachnospiraceae bacterium KH1T2]|nr:hypothetical protein SAMN05216390_10563 [Lachnospiraceae bacterium KH1T2]
MAEYLSPGVYVEEYDSSSRSIEGVGTSTAGFIGMAVKGPTVGAPEFITSYAEFTRKYGGPLSEFTHGDYRFLAPAIEHFFTNGGTRCFVSRVVPSDAKCASAKAGALTIEAVDAGAWGNKIQVSFETQKKRKLQLVKKVAEGVYEARSAGGFREGDIVSIGDEYSKIESIFDDQITFSADFKEDVVDASLVPEKVLYLVEFSMNIRYLDSIESYSGLNFNAVSPDYIATRLADSEIIKVTVTPTGTVGNPLADILGEDVESGIVVLSGGNDGKIDKVNAGTFIGVDGGPGKRTGIQSFLENTVVSMIAVPGVTMPEVIVSLIAHCENLKSRFAVLDMPRDMSDVNKLKTFRGMFDSSYAAMYHPWIQTFDRSTEKSGYFPPSGAVMGIYARSDVARGVHKAPANENVMCSGLNISFGKAEQDMLNPEGINLIREIPGQGIKVWGARTISSNSNFKYVNVRRLFIYVEESIKANTNWVVFEPNDQTLWTRVGLTISSFLNTMWRNGMFSGGSPEESYFVDIGPTTMTQDDIKNGRLVCNIGIAPSRPAEFVIFRVTQFTAESGGGEG